MNKEVVTLHRLEKEIDSLKKKMFVYETINSERDIKKRKILGPFKRGKDILKVVKH